MDEIILMRKLKRKDEWALGKIIDLYSSYITYIVWECGMSSLRTLLAILKGEAVVLTKKSEHKADVLVGKNVDKRFAINSMVGAVKALML